MDSRMKQLQALEQEVKALKIANMNYGQRMHSYDMMFSQFQQMAMDLAVRMRTFEEIFMGEDPSCVEIRSKMASGDIATLDDFKAVAENVVIPAMEKESEVARAEMEAQMAAEAETAQANDTSENEVRSNLVGLSGAPLDPNDLADGDDDEATVNE